MLCQIDPVHLRILAKAALENYLQGFGLVHRALPRGHRCVQFGVMAGRGAVAVYPHRQIVNPLPSNPRSVRCISSAGLTAVAVSTDLKLISLLGSHELRVFSNRFLACQIATRVGQAQQAPERLLGRNRDALPREAIGLKRMREHWAQCPADARTLLDSTQ